VSVPRQNDGWPVGFNVPMVVFTPDDEPYLGRELLDAAWSGSAVFAASPDAAVHDAAHRHLRMVDGVLVA